MIEHLISIRIPYLQEVRRRHHRTFEEIALYSDETVCIREVDVGDAPVAYVVSGRSSPAGDFLIRSHDGALFWPVELGHPLTPDRFTSLAHDGDATLTTALGVERLNARVTLEEFEKKTELRDLGRSTLDEARARLQRGAARTIWVGGRTLFAAGPPAYFRPYHEKHMIIGALGIGAEDYGNDGAQGCYIPGPSRQKRKACGGAGTAIGIHEIHEEIADLPDGLYDPDIGQTIETIRDLTPPHAAASFCEREFPLALRKTLANKYDYGQRKTELLESLDLQLREWVRSQVDTPRSTRQLLRRFADGPEEAFKYEFQFEASAARAILRRLSTFGLEGGLNEADDQALRRFGEGG